MHERYGWLLMSELARRAAPLMTASAHPDARRLTGRFFDRCQLAPDVADPELQKAFWAACHEMTGERWPGVDRRLSEPAAPSHG